MPYAINRKDIENVLKKFKKVVRNNGPLQALRCIKIQGDGSVIKLSCTDGQVSVSEEIPGEFPAIFCVNLKELTTILKSIRSPEIFIDLDQDKVLISTAEGESFTLPTFPAEDFPVIGDRDGAKVRFRISSCSLHAGLKRCYPFASYDSSRPYIHGAHFLCGGNSLRIESTDGHRLFIESGMLCEVRAAADFIIPYPLLPVLLGMTKKNPGTVEVSENAGSIYFTMEGAMVSARKTDSVFPPVSTVIPESPVIACKALRKELLSAVESARKMGGRDTTGGQAVRPRRLGWARLLKRVLQVDALSCARCRAAMVVIAFITDLVVCRKILEHLKLPSIPPEIKPARVEDEWPVDERWDEEDEGEGGSSPPGSASRGPPHLGEKFLSPHSILRPGRKNSGLSRGA